MKRFLVLGVLLCFGILSFGAGSSYAAQKKALMLIAADQFQDDEFAVPKGILEKNGIQVTVASTTLAEITGMNGAKAKADILLKDVKAADYDAVLFIGGAGAAQYIDDPVAHKLAQDAVAANKIVGAICIAPVCLARSGVLKGKNATTYPVEANQKELSSCGVNYTGKPLEKDGNIITADGPNSAKEFGEEISRALFE